MQLIQPINEEMCSKLAGMPVAAMLNDGTRHYGILSRVVNGKIILNDEALPSVTAEKRRKRANKKAREAQIFAYPNPQPNPETSFSFGPRVALNLANVSALYLLVD